MGKLAVDPRPCSSCPYRKDTPSGVWDPEEYEKLPDYDEGAETAIGVFLCHHSLLGKAETVCRGWLSVHAESPAARLAVLNGMVTDEERYAPVDVPLYGSGAEAAAAGMAHVDAPSSKAMRLIDRLTARRDRTRGDAQ